MKTWQEVSLDLGIVLCVSVLTGLKIVSPEAWLLIVGPLVGAHVSNKAKKGNGGNGSTVPPASAALAILAGAAALMSSKKS
jgi:hypothetical protein